MTSMNKDSSQKDILDDGINVLAVNVEQNCVRPYMSELTSTTMMDLTQTSTKIFHFSAQVVLKSIVKQSYMNTRSSSREKVSTDKSTGKQTTLNFDKDIDILEA